MINTIDMIKSIRKFVLTPAALLVIASSGNILADAGPSSEIMEARQESRILTTYALHRYLYDQDLGVTIDGGVVTLTGHVREDISKELAQQIALGVRGISHVNNEITVNPDYVASKPSNHRSYSEVVQDATITAAVKSKLLWSKHAEGLSAKVETRSGEVTLRGTASSHAAREMAGLLAQSTHGVHVTNNQLVIDKESTTLSEIVREKTSYLGKQISDTLITARVKSTLIYSKNIDSSDISVDTKDGMVTLAGRVPDGSEQALAIELARNVRGVSSVNARNLNRSKGFNWSGRRASATGPFPF